MDTGKKTTAENTGGMTGYVAAILKKHDFPTEWGEREYRNPISQYNCGRITDMVL